MSSSLMTHKAISFKFLKNKGSKFKKTEFTQVIFRRKVVNLINGKHIMVYYQVSSFICMEVKSNWNAYKKFQLKTWDFNMIVKQRL